MFNTNIRHECHRMSDSVAQSLASVTTARHLAQKRCPVSISVAQPKPAKIHSLFTADSGEFDANFHIVKVTEGAILILVLYARVLSRNAFRLLTTGGGRKPSPAAIKSK